MARASATKPTGSPKPRGAQQTGPRKAKRATRRSPTGRAAQPQATPAGVEAESGSEPPRWTFFTNHAHVLICLYQDSEAILREIAARVGITERAVQRIVQELEEAGFVKRERVGRRNHYTVTHHKSLRHPIEEHCSVDELFAVILDKQVRS